MFDFSDPIATDVKEILVLGPGSAAVADLDGLIGMTITVRASSSYHEHLVAMNRERVAKGSAPFSIALADEALEDEDLMELVNVGVLQATIVDEPKARLFAKIFDKVVVREDLAINSGGHIAWAIRKGSPKLSASVNGFVATVRKGTMLGNVIIKRHLSDVERIRNALNSEDESRYRAIIPLIEKYASTYDFDALMIAAQGYQESRLDQSTRSAAGAIGIMQVLPSTASDPVIGIVDIEKPDRNVEAGIKYLRHLRNRYLDDPAIDRVNQMLMSFAAYNAGPTGLIRARKRTTAMGLDANRWFGNVELGMALAISREPVVYVRNILKYYVTYRLAAQQETVKPGIHATLKPSASI